MTQKHPSNSGSEHSLRQIRGQSTVAGNCYSNQRMESRKAFVRPDPTAGDIATEFQRNRAPLSKRRQRSDPEFAKACALTPNWYCCRAVAKIGL
jgi:hypothetical protein